jgi:regulator of nonsense transcripts 2
MHAFIQHVLHDVLMKRTLDKVLKLMRKLHWEDAEVGKLHQSSLWSR